MQSYVVGKSIGEAWEKSVLLLLDSPDCYLVSSATGGDCWELENVFVEVSDPLRPPRTPANYPFPNLIKDFASLTARKRERRPEDAQTIADRIYRWKRGRGRTINQFRGVVKELRRDRTSRRAVIAIWDPVQDLLPDVSPLGHCFMYFSIRANALNLCVVSRSVEAWVGALPNMLAFSDIQQRVAKELGVPVGQYTLHALSYHIYLHHIPMIRQTFAEVSAT